MASPRGWCAAQSDGQGAQGTAAAAPPGLLWLGRAPKAPRRAANVVQKVAAAATASARGSATHNSNIRPKPDRPVPSGVPLLGGRGVRAKGDFCRCLHLRGAGDTHSGSLWSHDNHAILHPMCAALTTVHTTSTSRPVPSHACPLPMRVPFPCVSSSHACPLLMHECPPPVPIQLQMATFALMRARRTACCSRAAC